MSFYNNIFKFFNLLIVILTLTSCEALKYKKVDANEFPPDPKERIKKNMEEGRGFRLLSSNNNNNTTYSFASSNPLWRATLDTIDFMPLASANYSGGIVITDWYSENATPQEAIKISIRFLTNEIRSDALDINVFYKECLPDLYNCKVSKKNDQLVSQLTLSILKKASQYEKDRIEKNKKDNPYTISTPTKKSDKKK
ncbi:DUF3576 domain-containing protein [Candidatus Pelagibacter sp.]|nr:DUF3576 domain-containing protein [Candidatus Pelagibacter sp.]